MFLAIGFFLAAGLGVAPAFACRGDSEMQLWLDGAPTDAQPGEVVLEVVRGEPSEPIYPPYVSRDGATSPLGMYRLKVTRTLVGDFHGAEVLVYLSQCKTWMRGNDTGIISGFLTPAEPYWTDAPALIARDQHWPRRLAQAADLRSQWKAGDIFAGARLVATSLDPAERKSMLSDVVQSLEKAADSGNAEAREWLIELGTTCCVGMPFNPAAQYARPKTTRN